MKYPSDYLKLRVLAAIDRADGKTIRDRIRNVSELTFEDEEGNRHRFTWRTIETWRLRYQKHGITAISRNPRCDTGLPRKVTPEEVQEAIEQARPFFRGNDFKLSELYRCCIERGFLRRDQIAPNTFRRVIKNYDLITPDKDTTNKKRLAFAKRFANDAARQRGDGIALSLRRVSETGCPLGGFVNSAGRQTRFLARISAEAMPRCRPSSSPLLMMPRGCAATASSLRRKTL